MSGDKFICCGCFGLVLLLLSPMPILVLKDVYGKDSWTKSVCTGASALDIGNNGFVSHGTLEAGVIHPTSGALLKNVTLIYPPSDQWNLLLTSSESVRVWAASLKVLGTYDCWTDGDRGYSEQYDRTGVWWLFMAACMLGFVSLALTVVCVLAMVQ